MREFLGTRGGKLGVLVLAIDVVWASKLVVRLWRVIEFVDTSAFLSQVAISGWRLYRGHPMLTWPTVSLATVLQLLMVAIVLPVAAFGLFVRELRGRSAAAVNPAAAPSGKPPRAVTAAESTAAVAKPRSEPRRHSGLPPILDELASSEAFKTIMKEGPEVARKYREAMDTLGMSPSAQITKPTKIREFGAIPPESDKPQTTTDIANLRFPLDIHAWVATTWKEYGVPAAEALWPLLDMVAETDERRTAANALTTCLEGVPARELDFVLQNKGEQAQRYLASWCRAYNPIPNAVYVAAKAGEWRWDRVAQSDEYAEWGRLNQALEDWVSRSRRNRAEQLEEFIRHTTSTEWPSGMKWE